jgi:hypothetical protein
MAESARVVDGNGLAQPAIEAFARDWYRKLDRHVPATELLPMLSATELRFELPEGPLTSLDQFRAWYEGGQVGDRAFPGVINIFFDEVHTVTQVAVSGSGARVTVDVEVNWQARRWYPPAPRSQWIGFDAFQQWEMTLSPAGAPVIARYVVNELRPMPGSPPL